MDLEKNLSEIHKIENNAIQSEKPKMTEEEKKLWEVDEDILNNGEELDTSGKITVMGAPVVYSSGFVRPYNPLRRPKIRYRNFIIALVLFIAGLSGTIILGNTYLPQHTCLISLGFSLIYLLIIGKRAVIWLVHYYQSKASDDTRLRCRFEPSCSEYMIKSVTKYGFLKGTFKGIKRVLRCRAPNGGIDYP